MCGPSQSATQRVCRIITDPQTPQRRAGVLRQSAVRRGDLVGIHLVVPGLDIDDQDLPDILVSFQLLAQVSRVDLLATLLHFSSTEPGM
jgi:hypothetical protein